jgi:hypothetical protein
MAVEHDKMNSAKKIIQQIEVFMEEAGNNAGSVSVV